jgi:hypothetical protein
MHSFCLKVECSTSLKGHPVGRLFLSHNECASRVAHFAHMTVIYILEKLSPDCFHVVLYRCHRWRFDNSNSF